MSYQRLPSQERSSPYNEAHCIQAGAIENGEASILKDVTLNWQKIENYEYYDDVRAASYKDLVFFSKRHSQYDQQEVIQLIPESMETSTIYRFDMGDDNYRYRRFHRDRRLGFLLFNGICGLGLASYLMISKQGLVSGFFPLAVTLSLILSVLQDTNNDGIAFPELRITLGTIFLLFLIYNDGNNTRLPAWVGKDVLTWALYGWISSFVLYVAFIFVSEYDSRWHGGEGLAAVLVILVGVVLGHPTLQATGYIAIVGSVPNFFSFGYDADPEYLIFPLLGGLGCIVLGNWIAANKEMNYSRLKYVGWYISRWIYVKLGGSRPRYTSE